jgi:hypothetical protein
VVDSLFRFGPKHTDKISIKLDFYGVSYRFFLVPTQENSLVLDEERCLLFQGNNIKSPYEMVLGSGHKESRLPAEAKKNRVKPPLNW